MTNHWKDGLQATCTCPYTQTDECKTNMRIWAKHESCSNHLCACVRVRAMGSDVLAGQFKQAGNHSISGCTLHV